MKLTSIDIGDNCFERTTVLSFKSNDSSSCFINRFESVAKITISRILV